MTPDSRQRLIPWMLGTALFQGLIGAWLLRTRPGLNIVLWVTPLLAATWLIGRQASDRGPQGEGRWFTLLAVLIAATCAWRDAPILRALSTLALLATIVIAVPTFRDGRVRQQAGISGFAVLIGRGLATILTGGVKLLGDGSWSLGGNRWHILRSLLRGLLLALPLLFVFGALFASDPAYRQLLRSLPSINLPAATSYVATFFAWTWVAAGIVRSATWSSDQAARQEQTVLPAAAMAVRPSLGLVEIVTVLGSVNLLFISFVIVQFGYLFGGNVLVQLAPGLTYADYARQGFFELVTAAALVLPTLLIGHWLLRPGDQQSARWFRILAGLLIALVYSIMASAVHRLWLYQQAYGLTELRLLATALIVWLGLVFAWLGRTVLRGQRDRFMIGALAASYLVLFALQITNPHALIARVNLDRWQTHGRFDARYAASLSGDAAPAILNALHTLPPADRHLLARVLLDRWAPRTDRSFDSRPEDWRSWNLGAARARNAVAAGLDELNSHLHSNPSTSNQQHHFP